MLKLQTVAFPPSFKCNCKKGLKEFAITSDFSLHGLISTDYCRLFEIYMNAGCRQKIENDRSEINDCLKI